MIIGGMQMPVPSAALRWFNFALPRRYNRRRRLSNHKGCVLACTLQRSRGTQPRLVLISCSCELRPRAHLRAHATPVPADRPIAAFTPASLTGRVVARQRAAAGTGLRCRCHSPGSTYVSPLDDSPGILSLVKFMGRLPQQC
jgi:hypothetical protein